jgi:hypothetical protein
MFKYIAEISTGHQRNEIDDMKGFGDFYILKATWNIWLTINVMKIDIYLPRRQGGRVYIL